LNDWVDYVRPNYPGQSETEMWLLAASYIRNDFGELLFPVAIAIFLGLGLAVVSVYLERRLTVAGLVGFLVNGLPILFFGQLLFAYQLLRSPVVNRAWQLQAGCRRIDSTRFGG
jgi:hypothetical protein